MSQRKTRAKWDVQDLGWAYLVSETYRGMYAGARNLNRFATSLFELYLGKRIRFYTAHRLKAYALIAKDFFTVEAVCIDYHKVVHFLFCIGKPEHFLFIAQHVGANRVLTLVPIPGVEPMKKTYTETPEGRKSIFVYKVPNPVTSDLRR